MPFAKGTSGNPSGIRKSADTALSYQSQAQKYAGEGLTKLRKLIKSKNESIALRASIAMGEIAFPKSAEGNNGWNVPDGVDPTEEFVSVYEVQENTAPPLPDAPKTEQEDA